MFDEVEREFSPVRLFLHVILGCWVPMAVLVLLESVSWLWFQPSGSPIEQALTYVVTGAAGLALGHFVELFRPGFAREGRRAGFVPAGFWAFCFVMDLVVQPAETFGFFYYPPGPGGGEGAIILLLLTLPTWSCAWYSVGMAHAARGKAGSGG